MFCSSNLLLERFKMSFYLYNIKLYMKIQFKGQVMLNDCRSFPATLIQKGS